MTRPTPKAPMYGLAGTWAVAWTLAITWAAAAPAQPAAPPPPTSAPTPTPPALDPPEPVSRTAIPIPAEATALTAPVVVRVRVLVEADGAVSSVTRLAAPNPPWDDAVIGALQQWRFRPGRYQGNPVRVAIAYSHTFVPVRLAAVAAPGDGGPALVAELRGKVVEKGTRAPAAAVTVAVDSGGRRYRAETDAKGRFRLPLPAGQARVSIHGSGYLPFAYVERLAVGERLAVAYAVERERYDPYEIVVYGQQRRRELSRVTLRGPEIQQVPGTFGDPFRVVATLPGVASVISLLPLPIVRGASPGSTGFLLDGTRVPLLFHLLSGPSVIHPLFIDEIQFYPGGAPVLYGGYTAGIIDGRTRRARADEKVIDVDLNALQTGALFRWPVAPLGATLTLAGRIGYPGLVLSLATSQASLSYWDYQARLDGGDARNGWTVFAFGAWDEVQGPAEGADPADPEPPLEPVLQLGFHRLDLRGQLGRGPWDGSARLVAGMDTSLSGGSAIRKWVIEPTLRGRWRARANLELVGGVEGMYHDTELVEEASTDGVSSDVSSAFTNGLRYIASISALSEALWRPTPRWLVRPGVRVDQRGDGTTWKLSADPRVAARYRLGVAQLPGLADDVTPAADDDARATWLKGGLGVFSQPPRLFLPLPGLDALPLRFGLLRAIQASVGAEVGAPHGLSLGVETYFNWMDPVVFDLEVNAASLAQEAQTALVRDPTVQARSPEDVAVDRLLVGQRGRAYGLEFLLRRQSAKGPYGWISYTLSLSEREKSGVFVPYDFDRTHLLNIVAGLPLPRNWDLGLRLQYQSGRPATTTTGYNAARSAGYFRLDLRIDKRAVWRKWLLDFYVDLTNIALMPEEVTPGASLRYVLPTVGLRARL